MKPEPWPLPTAERHSTQNACVLIHPPASPTRHTRDLTRIDQPLRRSARTEVGRKTLNDTIRNKVSNPVHELRLSKRLIEPPTPAACACIVPSRLLRAHGHPGTIPDG